jgi:hypothetical protein
MLGLIGPTAGTSPYLYVGVEEMATLGTVEIDTKLRA